MYTALSSQTVVKFSFNFIASFPIMKNHFSQILFRLKKFTLYQIGILYY
jgi:hypothetical protein